MPMDAREYKFWTDKFGEVHEKVNKAKEELKHEISEVTRKFDVHLATPCPFVAQHETEFHSDQCRDIKDHERRYHESRGTHPSVRAHGGDRSDRETGWRVNPKLVWKLVGIIATLAGVIAALVAVLSR